MIKRFIFRIMDALLVSLFLFFISYAFFEIKLETKNSAFLFSIFVTLALGSSYFFIRGIFLDRRARKNENSLENELLLKSILLMPDKVYYKTLACLFKENCEHFSFYKDLIKARDENGNVLIFCGRLAKEIPLGSRELMPFIRTCMNIKADRCVIISLTGIDKSGMGLLDEYPIKAEIIPFQQLVALLEENKIEIPHYLELEKPKKNKLGIRFNSFLGNPKAFRTCIKYSMLLAFISAFTPYKFYYITAAVLLTGLGIYSKIKIRQLHSKNIF